MRKCLLACWLLIGCSVYGNGPVKVIDSLKAILNGPQPANREEVLARLSEAYLRLDFGLSLAYADSAYKEAKKSGNETVACKAGLYRAVAFMNLGKLDSSVILSTHIITHCREEKEIVSKAHNVRGLALMKQKRSEEAVADFLATRRIAESIGDKLLEAKAMTNLGLTYMELNQPSRAKEFFLGALAIFEGKDIGSEALVCSNLAACYGSLNKLDSVRIYGERALKITMETGDVYTGANVSNILSVYYQKTGDWEKAEALLIEARNMRANIQDPYFMVADQITLAEFYQLKKDWKNAEKNALQALNTARELDVLGKFENLFHLLGNIYSGSDNHEMASQYYRMWAIEKDSNYAKASKEVMADMQVKYETEKKEKENLRLLNETREREVWIFGLATLSLFILLVSVVFISSQKNRQKAQREKERIQHEKDRFRALMDGTEKERERIARDLHDGLGQLLINTKMQVILAMEDHKPENKKPGELLDEAIDEVRNISHDLMPGSLSRLGLAASLRDLEAKINAGGRVSVSVDIPEKLHYSPELDKNIYRIVQEVCTNMLKHSGATGIGVKLAENDGYVNMEISDNGRGFDISKIDNSGGLGWKNIQTRVSVNEGTLTIQSSANHGTKVIISLPVITA